MASAVTKEAIARVAKEIFGRVSGLQMYGKANGQRFLKQELTGVYLDRYYPESIDKAARTATPGFTTELYDRRQEKLARLRRRGKGPPKKGQGKRASKKGGKK